MLRGRSYSNFAWPSSRRGVFLAASGWSISWMKLSVFKICEILDVESKCVGDGEVTFLCRMQQSKHGIFQTFALSPDMFWKLRLIEISFSNISHGSIWAGPIYHLSSWAIGANRLLLETKGKFACEANQVLLQRLNSTPAPNSVFSCQTCFMAYDVHIARCVVPLQERRRYICFEMFKFVSCPMSALCTYIVCALCSNLWIFAGLLFL